MSAPIYPNTVPAVTACNLFTLDQVRQLTGQLSNDELTRPLPVLSGNTLGKHIRHLLEFYLCLLKGMPSGTVDYDARERDLLLETDTTYIKQHIRHICDSLENTGSDMPLTLAFHFRNEVQLLPSSLYRELAYHEEHTVHHLALIKIAINSAFNHIQLPPGFGVAYSTLAYQNQSCAQ